MTSARTLTALGVVAAMLVPLLAISTPTAHAIATDPAVDVVEEALAHETNGPAAPEEPEPSTSTDPGLAGAETPADGPEAVEHLTPGLGRAADTPEGSSFAPRETVLPTLTAAGLPGHHVVVRLDSSISAYGALRFTAPQGTTVTAVRDSDGGTDANEYSLSNGYRTVLSRGNFTWGPNGHTVWVTLKIGEQAVPGTTLPGGLFRVTAADTELLSAAFRLSVSHPSPPVHGYAGPGESIELAVWDPDRFVQGLAVITAPPGTSITAVRDDGMPPLAFVIGDDGATATAPEGRPWGAQYLTAWVTLRIDDDAVPGAVLDGGHFQVHRDGHAAGHADLSITVTSLLEITEHPVDTTAVEGTPAEFATAAAGEAHTTRWQVSRDAGAAWDDIDGATGDALVTADTSRDMNEWQYRAVHTSTTGTVITSDPALLRVRTAPYFFQHPTLGGALAPPGYGYHLTAGASETAAVISEYIEWELSMDGRTWTPMDDDDPGSTGLLLPVTAEMDGMLVRATVETDLGSAISDSALIRVDAPPVVAEHPVDVRTIVGRTASFAASTPAVSPHRTQQWQERSGEGEWTDLPGATGASLTTAATTSEMDQREYRIVFTNQSGSTASEHATLTVHEMPPQAHVVITPAVRLVDRLP